MLLRDMGAPVCPSLRKRTPTIVHHKGYQRFRIAATAVVAALRIQRLQQRRQQRLQKALQRCSGHQGVSSSSQTRTALLSSPSSTLPTSWFPPAPLVLPHQQTVIRHSPSPRKSRSPHNIPTSTVRSSPYRSAPSPKEHSYRATHGADPQVEVYLKKLEKLQERLASSRARHTPQ